MTSSRLISFRISWRASGYHSASTERFASRMRFSSSCTPAPMFDAASASPVIRRIGMTAGMRAIASGLMDSSVRVINAARNPYVIGWFSPQYGSAMYASTSASSRLSQSNGVRADPSSAPNPLSADTGSSPMPPSTACCTISTIVSMPSAAPGEPDSARPASPFPCCSAYACESSAPIEWPNNTTGRPVCSSIARARSASRSSSTASMPLDPTRPTPVDDDVRPWPRWSGAYTA